MQHETDAQDLSADENAKEATEIVRIGYYDDSKTIRVAQNVFEWKINKNSIKIFHLEI
nr:hypothetical protein [Mycoplasmopsis bovis]